MKRSDRHDLVYALPFVRAYRASCLSVPVCHRASELMSLSRGVEERAIQQTQSRVFTLVLGPWESSSGLLLVVYSSIGCPGGRS